MSVFENPMSRASVTKGEESMSSDAILLASSKSRWGSMIIGIEGTELELDVDAPEAGLLSCGRLNPGNLATI